MREKQANHPSANDVEGIVSLDDGLLDRRITSEIERSVVLFACHMGDGAERMRHKLNTCRYSVIGHTDYILLTEPFFEVNMVFY